MADETKLASADATQVSTGGATPPEAGFPPRRDALKRNLADRKAHLAELEKRVKRKDYSPAKLAQYRAALARASAEVKALTKELSDGDD